MLICMYAEMMIVNDDWLIIQARDRRLKIEYWSLSLWIAGDGGAALNPVAQPVQLSDGNSYQPSPNPPTQLSNPLPSINNATEAP